MSYIVKSRPQISFEEERGMVRGMLQEMELFFIELEKRAQSGEEKHKAHGMLNRVRNIMELRAGDEDAPVFADDSMTEELDSEIDE
jgi:hypothetical protein